MGRIADYVFGVLDEIFDEPAEREKRVAWATGDPRPRTGRSALLAFDAVWESWRLIVEVEKGQHRRPVKFSDKPDIADGREEAYGIQRVD